MPDGSSGVPDRALDFEFQISHTTKGRGWVRRKREIKVHRPAGRIRKAEKTEGSTEVLPVRPVQLVSHLPEVGLISAFSPLPIAKANFLPAKRSSETVALPLLWSTTAESYP